MCDIVYYRMPRVSYGAVRLEFQPQRYFTDDVLLLEDCVASVAIEDVGGFYACQMAAFEAFYSLHPNDDDGEDNEGDKMM
jgi:hypothetical protein